MSKEAFPPKQESDTNTPVGKPAGVNESDALTENTASWVFNIYITGYTPRCVDAINNVKRFCDQYLPYNYTIKIIDLLNNPNTARAQHIVAIPTIDKTSPPPLIRATGNIDDAVKFKKLFGIPETTT